LSAPCLSVVLPVFNAEAYLEEAIDSVLAQTFSNFELLIYNDGSTDKSDMIIRSFNDDRVIYERMDCQKGLVYILNKGIESAEGRYIARMDADDIAFPNRFQEQIAFLEANPDVGICGTWIEFMGKKTGVVKRPVSFEEVQYQLFFGCPLTHPTMMMRNKFLKKYGLRYNEEYFYAEDHELLLRGSHYFKIVNLPLVLLRYRVHETQIGSAHWMEQLRVKNSIQAKIFTEVIMPASDSDRHWLFDFFMEQSVPNRLGKVELEYFKQKILNQNKENKVYREDILIRAVNELFPLKIKANFYNYYLAKYYRQKIYGLHLLQRFLLDSNKPYLVLGKKLTIVFIIKCLLNYRKKA
jgi:glycosyltransferase involved in cell wall biosynthesis